MDKKEQKAVEKARKIAEKEQLKEDEKRRKESVKQLQDTRKKNQEDLEKTLADSKGMTGGMIRKKSIGIVPETPSSPSTHVSSSPIMGRTHRGSKSFSRKSLNMGMGSLFSKDKGKEKGKMEDGPFRENGRDVFHRPESNPSESAVTTSGTAEFNGSEGARTSSNVDRPPDTQHGKQALKERFSFSMGRKKSMIFP